MKSIRLDDAGSPILDRRAHVDVIVWKDDIIKNVLPIPTLADMSTQVKRIVDFEPVDGPLSYHRFLIPTGHELIMHSSQNLWRTCPQQ
jgi:hypothetical protein